MAPFTALAVGVDHKANTEHPVPGIKERNHPHAPMTDHIPQEELDALTNGEHFKRFLNAADFLPALLRSLNVALLEKFIVVFLSGT
ncbi:hypothetical protein FS837_001086 [Tulasnella sp. UAMH 9824]|nr:hypothetical protein FS837_001086 [Tulasnella sp. UAMH 9824]